MMVFLKDFFEKVNFENSQQTKKDHNKFPSIQGVNHSVDNCFLSFVGVSLEIILTVS